MIAKASVRTSFLDANVSITCTNGHYICRNKYAVVARNDRLPKLELVDYEILQPPLNPELPDTMLCIACRAPWLYAGPLSYTGEGGYWSMYQYRLRYWSLFAIQMYLISPAYPHLYPVSKIHTSKGWWP